MKNMYRFAAALLALALTLSLSHNASAQFKADTAAPAQSGAPQSGASQSELEALKAQNKDKDEQINILKGTALQKAYCEQLGNGAAVAPKPPPPPVHRAPAAPKKPKKFICDAAQLEKGVIAEDRNFCRCENPDELVPVLVHPTENVIACVARAEVYKYILALQAKYDKLNKDLQDLVALIGDPEAFRRKMEQIATMASDIDALKANDAKQDGRLDDLEKGNTPHEKGQDKAISDLGDEVKKAKGASSSDAFGAEGGGQIPPHTTATGIIQAYWEHAQQFAPGSDWSVIYGAQAGLQAGPTFGSRIRIGGDIGVRYFLDEKGTWALDMGGMGYTAMSGELPRNFGPGWPFKLSGVEAFVGPRVLLNDHLEGRLRCGLGGATVDYVDNNRFQQSDGLTGHCTIGIAPVFGRSSKE